MGVVISDEAHELIARSLAQGGYDPAQVAVRLRIAGGAVRPRFVQTPEEGDIIVESSEVRVFVDPQIVEFGDVVIGVSTEHESLIVVPA